MITRLSRRILITTFGSLGDLHPYIALARELQRRGHTPLIGSFDLHRPAVEAAAIEFRAIRPGLEVFGDIESVVAKLFGSWRGPEYMVREIFMKHLRDSYADTLEAAQGADLLITHPLTFAARLVAEKRSLPWVSTVLAPLNLFSAIEPPAYPVGAWLKWLRMLGVAPYRSVFNLLKRMIAHWERPLQELRRELGLPLASSLAQFEGQFSPLLNLALFSPQLSVPQLDWPPHTVMCGFARYDGGPVAAELQAELRAFLDAGNAPLVFALGSSAVMMAGNFWQEAAAAAKALGRRAILLTGLTADRQPDFGVDIKAFQYLPYSLVFPHAAAIVHQAGIGTLAQALAAGRPQLIVPVAFDQPDNARRAARLGVARVLPFKRATAARLTAHLRYLLREPEYARQGSAVAAALAQEDGVHAACNEIEGLLMRR